MNARTYTGTVINFNENSDWLKVSYIARGKERTTIVSRTYYNQETKQYETVGNILNHIIEFDDIHNKIRRIYT